MHVVLPRPPVYLNAAPKSKNDPLLVSIGGTKLSWSHLNREIGIRSVLVVLTGFLGFTGYSIQEQHPEGRVFLCRGVARFYLPW